MKLALMTADSHPQPDVFEVDSRAPLAQTLSRVAQHDRGEVETSIA